MNRLRGCTGVGRGLVLIMMIPLAACPGSGSSGGGSSGSGSSFSVAPAVALGEGFSCAMDGQGLVKCWGENSYGQLAQGIGIDHRGDDANEMGDSLAALDFGSGRVATAFAVGRRHSCALLDNGEVKCWGENSFGQLGNPALGRPGDEPGEMGDTLPAIDLGAGRTAQALAVGSSHTCALLDDNSVKCWGYGTWGQLGQGDRNHRGDDVGEMGDALPAIDLGAGRTAQALAVGSSHTCALLDDNSVKCWGDNDFGQLGLGDQAWRGDQAGEMGDALPAVDLGTGRSALAIAAGTFHTCALLDDNSLKCWGRSFFGELGQGDTVTRGDDAGEMGDALPAIDLGIGRTAQAIALGSFYSCALLDDGSVKCWGHNGNGQLGLGDNNHRGDEAGEMGNALPAIDLGTGRTAQALAAGSTHNCALLDNNQIKCWGYNSQGQLGQGDTVGRGRFPGEMGDNLGVVDLGTGLSANVVFAGSEASSVCAVLNNGAAKCWGDNYYGQLGLGTGLQPGDEPGELGSALPPINLGSGRRARQVSAGQYHVCALLDNGGAKCWGYNSQGQLGQGDANSRGDDANEMGDALPVIDLGTGRTAIAVTTGRYHSCALLDDRSVKCWGSNSYGELGQGDGYGRGYNPGEMGDNLTAIDLGTGRTAQAIGAGEQYTCALLDDGSVKCWGRNNLGQLGLGDINHRGDAPGEMGDALPAIDLGTGRTAQAIAVGGFHSCALLDDASVKCWGYNFYGQLGLGQGGYANRGDDAFEMGDSLPIVNLGTGRTAQAIAVGSLHSCALLDDASVKCWGYNSNGELGQGDILARGAFSSNMGDALTAIDLGTGRQVSALYTGPMASSTCALLDNSAIKCWGYNTHGQLGLGDIHHRGDEPGEMGDALPPIAP